MKLLETRTGRHGLKRRLYRDAGVTVTTYEVPLQVLSLIGPARLKAELDRADRALARKRMNARVLELLADGWKPLAVASEVGLCEAQVRRIRQKARAA